ncbi:MAG: rRNA (cytosine1962-C5)-methyltransferase [Candidatus Doudnabacteria bacterium]|nr:rRNA (cytosine1962-C5)-methyltransferase [Candidatus Doudnabacteria bacterium]
MIKEEIGDLKGYQLLDSGDGARLEKFGEYVLQKPDPAVLWTKSLPESEWKKADAIYIRGSEDRGNWKVQNKQMPEKWTLDYQIPNSSNPEDKITFYAKLNPFKHTGIFPEQAANWDFITEKLQAAKKQNKELKVLNLFGYTGIASVLAAKLGAKVSHVDASRPSLNDAKENMLMSGLPEDAIRWILDDAVKFTKREAARGNKYDAIILDPPAFGRGAKGEVWKFSDDLPKLLEVLRKVCSDDFQFLIINAYAVSVSAVLLKNLMEDFSKNMHPKFIDYGELILKQKNGRLLSTGIFARLH